MKGIIGMHRFNTCLIVVLLWCENTIRVPLNSMTMLMVCLIQETSADALATGPFSKDSRRLPR